MALRISSNNLDRGVRPTQRRPGLRDPIIPGEPGADRFGPQYQVIVNGTVIQDSIKSYIELVEYEDNEDMFDVIKITLRGMIEDPVDKRVKPIPEWVVESTVFAEGNIVWIQMGYHGSLRIIGAGEIVKREFDYGTSDPACTIICYEPLHRMANTFAEKAITYKGMRSSDIVKQIARKKEYSGVIGALFDVSKIARLPIFTPKAEVQKFEESDYAFLKRMAEVRGWQLYTRFDVETKKFALFYGPDSDKQEAIFRYEYNNRNLIAEDTLQTFKPTINTIDQQSEIKIVSVDEKRKKKLEHAPKYNSLADGRSPVARKFTDRNTDFKKNELKNPVSYRFQAFGLNRRIIATRPFKDENEVKKFIIQWARNNIKNFITGSGDVVGNEDIQSRQSHFFFGLGETFSGTDAHPAKWYLSKVTHIMSRASGGLAYTTKFDCRKVIDFLPDDEITANPPVQENQKLQKKAKFNPVAKFAAETE